MPGEACSGPIVDGTTVADRFVFVLVAVPVTLVVVVVSVLVGVVIGVSGVEVGSCFI